MRLMINRLELVLHGGLVFARSSQSFPIFVHFLVETTPTRSWKTKRNRHCIKDHMHTALFEDVSIMRL